MQDISLNQAVPKLRKSDGPGETGVYRQILAPAVARPYAVIEVVAGMGLVIACGYIAQPRDPLLLQLSFPWVWLAASVFALRYGAMLGVPAGLCVAGAWWLFYGVEGTTFPVMWFVGGMAQLVITGHFCDVWSARTRRLQAVNAYLDDSLVALTNHHYLLKVSHESLERDSLSKPFTLRDAFEYIRAMPKDDESKSLPNAEALLSFVANSCQISQAAIFAIKGGRKDIQPVPVASEGGQFELDRADALLQACLRSGDLAHLRQGGAGQSNYLVCAPISGASGKLLGVLVIRRMSFLSLNEDNLQLLLVLLSYYADGIEQYGLLKPVRDQLPACPDAFAIELSRLARLQRLCGVPSSLIGVVFPKSERADALREHFSCTRRGLDLTWAYECANARVVIVLLPLTDDAGVNAYFLRMELAAQTTCNLNLAAAQAKVCRTAVDFRRPGYGLELMVSWCNRHG